MTFTYWPDTEHPHYAEHAEMVRNLMADRRRAVVFANPGNPLRRPAVPIKRAAGPAPYVGRPFTYTWFVAIDDQDRWIAGPAEIHYLQPALYP